jgi:hypothetical protein
MVFSCCSGIKGQGKPIVILLSDMDCSMGRKDGCHIGWLLLHDELLLEKLMSGLQKEEKKVWVSGPLPLLLCSGIK